MISMNIRCCALLMIALVLSCCASASVATQPSLTLPVYGEFSQLFMYYTYVSVGTPPIEYSVVLDTGSSDFLIPYYTCTTCAGDPVTFYNPMNSSTSTHIPCSDPHYHCKPCSDSKDCLFQSGFVGITEDAIVSRDDVIVGGTTLTSSFGGITKIDMGSKKRGLAHTAEFIYPVGMWGLAAQSLSASGALPLLGELTTQGGYANTFSHCASDKVGGAITFGGPSPFVVPGTVQYTPLVQPMGFYSVNMTDIKVAGTSLGLPVSVYNNKHCIVDSGTPFPTVPSKVFSAITSLVGKLCSSTSLPGVCDVPQGEKSLFKGGCFPMTSKQINSFPTITFSLVGGVTLEYPPSQYIKPLYYCQKEGTYGLALQEDPSGFGTVIGMNLLQQYVSVYDIENQRMGFGGVSGCPSHTDPH